MKMRHRQPRSPGYCLPLALLLMLTTRALSQSQWVDWTNETTTRLQLTVVPLMDPEEKDIISGDVDKDGDDDILVVRKTPFSFPGAKTNILLMNENGILVDRTTALIPGFLIADDARDVLLSDLDGDGWLDVVVATTFQQQPRMFHNQGLNASGVFMGFVEVMNWFSPLFSPGPQFCAVYDGDIDNDGDLDLYFSDYNSPLEDRLLINDGTGHFTDETAARFPTGINNSVFGTASFICDFNLDGWNDIVKSSGSFDPLKLLINDGTGHFTQLQTLPSVSVYMVRTADFNNDGRRDLYVVSDGQDYLLMNNSTNPNGTINVNQIFVTGSNLTTGFGGNVKAADVDRDGFIDVGVADVDVDLPGCNRRFAVLRNTLGTTGTVGLTDPNVPSIQPWNSTGTHDLTWIDINGDGFLDLFQGRCSGYKLWIMQPFALAQTYGQGCSGSNGVPSIGTTGAPHLGNSAFAITLEGANPGVAPLLVFGSSRDASSFGNCQVLIGAPFVFGPLGPTTTLAGTSQINLPIPINPAFDGFRTFLQWAVPDPSGQLAGSIALSDALEIFVSSNQL